MESIQFYGAANVNLGVKTTAHNVRNVRDRDT